MTAQIDFDAAWAEILSAKTPGDLLRPGYEDADYRRLSRMVHPDMVPDDKKARANDAMAKLSQLYDLSQGKVGPVVIKTKKGSHPIGDLYCEGDISNIYTSGPNVVKMPLNPMDNDLMEAEARAIKRLDAEANPDFRHFAPVLVETFRHRDTTTGQERRVNVFDRLHDFYTLREVMDAFPRGIDPRDAAWMWRRLFVAIGLAHDNDLVHGAVTPENIMIHPKKHGVVLLDWVYSVDTRTDAPMKAMAKGYSAWYPDAVRDKIQPTHTLDTAFAAQTMLRLMGDRAPKAMRAFARGCSVLSTPSAAELLGEFDELLFNLYGKRKYREFFMP
jgi:hypothetical protein